jgi:hypothetical protein
MSDKSIFLTQLGFVLMSLVAALLAVKFFLRDLGESRRRRRTESWPITVFDTAPLRPRLKKVRADFSTAARVVPHARLHPKTLLDAARRTVLRLAYFQDREDRME